MKKNVLIGLIALSTLNVFSQIEKGKIIISVDGNFMKSNSESGVTTNQNVVQGKYLNAGASVGYFITDRIVAGFGIDYHWTKEDRTTQMFIGQYFQEEDMKIKSKVLLPNIYFGYYYPIINKLYFNANLKFSYGKVKSEYDIFIGGVINSTIDFYNTQSNPFATPYSMGKLYKEEVDYFSTEIIPELTYFVSPKFSLCLGLGGIDYEMTDWKAGSSNLAINFNPGYWKFGVKFKI